MTRPLRTWPPSSNRPKMPSSASRWMAPSPPGTPPPNDSTAMPATRSSSRRASSPWPTSSRPWPRTGPTARPWASTRRSRRSSSTAAVTEAAQREARGSRARLAVDSIRGTWPREREPLPAEQLDAGLGHLRVVETAAVLLDLLERRVDAQGRAVGPVRGHGLDDVGHGEDARLEDDLVAGKAPRVAGAVEALVVLQGHLGHRPGELDAVQHVVGGLRVRPDELKLDLRETPRLGEDLGRYLSLIHI